jgi:PAP2 superfamily
MKSIKSSLLTVTAAALILAQGCGTLSNGRGWGQDATLTPGWDRIKESAVNAALSPETWMPIAASLVLQVDDMDKRISDWASKKTPVFGSQENASDWGNYLEDSSNAVYLVTVMATPSGDDPSGWLTAKAKGLAIGVAASGITSGSTSLLKRITKRARPGDPNSDKSLPSGHASGTAVFTTLARRNLESISLSTGSRLFADIGIVGLAIGTGWSRVEAKAHYPSDVLVGYALGHFFSAFINDAFLGLDNKKAPLVTFEPSRKDVFVGLHWMF